MDDIFTHVREGNALKVRVWLDDTENDLNQGYEDGLDMFDVIFNFAFIVLICRDDHRFSLLHWAAREGWSNIVDILISRGARINATNMGDDTPLHLAAAHGHYDIVSMVSILPV